MTKRYRITNDGHPHFGMTGELANDQNFPRRTYVHFAPMFALKLDRLSLGTVIVYVDDMDVTEIDEDKNNN